MKKILTFITRDSADTTDDEVPEEVEILGTEGKNLSEALKKAKGRYTVLADGDLTCDITEDIFKNLATDNSDVLVFRGSSLFKTSVLKNLTAKQCGGKFSTEAYAAFQSKSIKRYNTQPFSFTPVKREYSEKEQSALAEILTEFAKGKSKLTKEIYSFTFDLLCDKLVLFYSVALLAIYDKKLKPEKLKEFDLKLKENIVLYLALDKRFGAGNLGKIREQNFKISFITALKLRKNINV